MSNKKFAIVCVAAIMFNASINTLVGVKELKSTDATQEEHVEIPKTKYDPNASEPSVSEASEPVVQNITINGDVYKDSDVTINNNTEEPEEEKVEKETKQEPVKEETDEPEKKKDLNNNSDIMTARRERGILVLGDPANDINPQEDIICVEHIKCPECGECEYKETYNKNNINCYLGRCSACGYEQ